MELYVLLEFLTLLWIVIEVARYFKSRKREQALIETLAKQDQRLSKLEKKTKEIP